MAVPGRAGAALHPAARAPGNPGALRECGECLFCEFVRGLCGQTKKENKYESVQEGDWVGFGLSLVWLVGFENGLVYFSLIG